MKRQFLCVLISIVFFSCNREEQKTFEYKELGWRMELPRNWKVMKMARIEQELEEAIEETKKISSLKFTGKEKVLLRLEKSDLNNLQATATPFIESYKGEWHTRYPILKNQLYNLFKDMGVKVDTISSTTEIGGVKFEVFDIDISEPLSRTKFHKRMFRTYLNEQDFVVNLTYERKRYGKQLEEAFRKSMFEQQ